MSEDGIPEGIITRDDYGMITRRFVNRFTPTVSSGGCGAGKLKKGASRFYQPG